MPVLVDDGRTVVEASIIIEHLGLHHPGPVRLIPQDPRAALDVRMMDRFFDNYVMTPMQKIVARQHPRARRIAIAHGVAEARALLDTAYRWLDEQDEGARVGGGRRASASPTARPRRRCSTPTGSIRSTRRFANVRAYRRRLLARPSFARAVDEARPYRPFFPLGAPDRD